MYVNSNNITSINSEITSQYKAVHKGKEDIHTKLMKKFYDIPNWWFQIMLAGVIVLSLVLCIFIKDQVQLPWWGLLIAAGLAAIFTLGISVITATTKQVSYQLCLVGLYLEPV